MLTLTAQRRHILRFNKRPSTFARAPPEGCCNPPAATGVRAERRRGLKPGSFPVSRESAGKKTQEAPLGSIAEISRRCATCSSPNRRKQVSCGDTPMHTHAHARAPAKNLLTQLLDPFASQSSPERGVSGVILECQAWECSSNTFSSSLFSFCCPGPLMILPR